MKLSGVPVQVLPPTIKLPMLTGLYGNRKGPAIVLVMVLTLPKLLAPK